MLVPRLTKPNHSGNGYSKKKKKESQGLRSPFNQMGNALGGTDFTFLLRSLDGEDFVGTSEKKWVSLITIPLSARVKTHRPIRSSQHFRVRLLVQRDRAPVWSSWWLCSMRYRPSLWRSSCLSFSRQSSSFYWSLWQWYPPRSKLTFADLRPGYLCPVWYHPVRCRCTH